MYSGNHFNIEQIHRTIQGKNLLQCLPKNFEEIVNVMLFKPKLLRAIPFKNLILFNLNLALFF